ncbi:MAG: hypothetical protein U0525_02085 [Patescibacteria group bacterium]
MNFKSYPKRLKSSVILVAICILFGLVTATFMYLLAQIIYLQAIKSEMTDFTNRIQRGISINGNSWNTSLYVSDPKTPHPQGSSGFTTPIYIITNDGFIIERSNAIPGMLDATDFEHFLNFKNVTTVKEATNETWSIKTSKILNNKNKTIGIVAASIYKPERFQESSVTNKIDEALNYIKSHIKVRGEKMDISNVDIREIDFDIAFEIVTNYNKTILSNGRNPSYIDKSLVYDESSKSEFDYLSTNDGELFLIHRQKIRDLSGSTVGITVIAESLKQFNTVLNQVVLISCIIFSLLYMLLVSLISRTNLMPENEKYKEIHKIMFDSENSELIINETSISIVRNSHQYILLKVLFTSTNYTSSAESIFNLFEDLINNKNNYRKVYDAMIAINKKAAPIIGNKLIIQIDNGFSLNPNLPIVK